MASEARTDFLIAGGGIGGLACALAVARTGASVRVLERTAEFREIGAGIQMAPNASRVLTGLGVMEAIDAVGYRPPRLRFMHAVTGETLTTLEFDEAFVACYGGPWITLHRNDLLQIIRDACLATGRVELLTGKEVVEVDTGTAVIRCADGSSYEAAGVLAADGVNSRLRALFVQDQPVASGYIDFRSIMPWSNAVGQETSGDVMAWVGPGMHAMQYPVRRGEVFNQLAGILSRRFLAGEAEWGSKEEFAEVMQGACPALRSALPALLASNARFELKERPPAPTWVKGRALMVGDAAHPILPFVGQGGCQALVDAAALGVVVGHYGPARVEAAFGAFESIRLPRTRRIQRETRAFGEVWHAEGASALIRDEFLRNLKPGDFRYTGPALLAGVRGRAHARGVAGAGLVLVAGRLAPAV